jgi:hypothetical protein
MRCQKYQILIEKYLDGDIKAQELTELKTHTQECASCREEFQNIDRLESTLKSAFSTATQAEQASDNILSQIKPVTIKPGPTLLFRKQMVVAASIFLAIGLLLGFGLARISPVRHIDTTAAKVPMQVSRLEGTILVKHRDGNLWQELKPDSAIYLGDTFHSTAKSAFIMKLGDKSTLELNQNSMLALTSFNGETQFFLEHGQCKASLESPHPPFFISTPHGRVEALGTEFTVTVE